MYKLGKNINLIVACQPTGGIGYQNSLPWSAPTDLKHFKQITSQIVATPGRKNALVMGRKTFESIGRPLPSRISYVVTRDQELLERQQSSVHYVSSLTRALYESTNDPYVDKVFVIGGAQIYNQVLQDWGRHINITYLTEIGTDHECDCYLNLDLIKQVHYPTTGTIHIEKNGTVLTFYEFHGRNPGEEEYLNLMRRILEEGTLRSNRTGIDTISIFGERMVFDISERIPFITTKRLAWKTMLRELLWFISGDTNNKNLKAKNVHIWNGNSTREYLDSIGLTGREEDDLGPVYGFQWKHFGAEYIDCHTDYTGQGVDQLAEVIRLLKEDPQSRRIIMSAWNPKAQPQMALPPCHLMAQWYVRNEEYLDCQMYQRSCDVALGVPFNIASYAVLTYMIAHVCGLHPGRYIQILGDAHIYTNHITAVKEQLARTPYQFPRLRFAREITDIDDFQEEDFILDDYQFHPPIKMDMAV